MSRDDKFQLAIDQYNLRREQEEADSPDRFESDQSARETYAHFRLAHIQFCERTVEARRWELQDLFDSVDKGELRKNQTQTKVLGEVTNILKTVRVHKQPQTVMRTETVPILPCKGYELPQKTLFIGGRSDYVKVSRPMEESQLDELLEGTRPVEEKILLECFSKQSEEQENEQAEKGTLSRVHTAKKLKKNGRESEEAGANPALPNCTVG